MPKTPTMTTAECEAELGPRGSLVVTDENRRTVRKWLNAQGFPALFSGGRSMRELGIAYNDTTGKGLEMLRRMMNESAADAGGAEAGEETFGAVVEKALERADAKPEAVKAKPQPVATPNVSAGPDMQRIAAIVGAVMASLPPQGVDAEAVKAIVDEALSGKTLSADDIRELVKDEAPKHVNVTRIEVRLPGSDDYTALDGHHHPQFAKLLKAASARQADGHHPNIWISGPAGSGKTHAAKMVAKALGRDFFYNGALSMSHELLGFIDAGGTYHATPFRHGYTGAAVYLFDEVDGSDNSALLALNAGLANGRASFPDGQAARHPDSIIIATANTWGLGATADYVGRAKIDAAFLSRFPVRIQWDYDAELEQNICGNAAWAKRVQKAREKARAAGIKVLIDPRASIGGAALIEAGFTDDEAAELTYLANLTKEQRQMVESR